MDNALFKRLTGVRRTTFETMADIVSFRSSQEGSYGRKSKISEDRLLMALEYMREYRTYFHIGQSYGVSESNLTKSAVVEDTD